MVNQIQDEDGSGDNEDQHRSQQCRPPKEEQQSGRLSQSGKEIVEICRSHRAPHERWAIQAADLLLQSKSDVSMSKLLAIELDRGIVPHDEAQEIANADAQQLEQSRIVPPLS